MIFLYLITFLYYVFWFAALWEVQYTLYLEQKLSLTKQGILKLNEFSNMILGI